VGRPAAPACLPHLLGKLQLQQLLRPTELHLLPTQQLVGLCCPLPLAPHPAQSRTTAESTGNRLSATRCGCQQSPMGKLPGSVRGSSPRPRCSSCLPSPYGSRSSFCHMCVLAPSGQWRGGAVWPCRGCPARPVPWPLWWVELAWPPGAHQATLSVSLLNRTRG